MLELQLFWNRMKPKCWRLECPDTSWLSPACGQQQSHRYLIHYRQFVQTCKFLTYHVWWQQCWSVVMHLDGTLQAHMMKNHIISIFSISFDAFAFWVFRFNNGACNSHFVVYIYDHAVFLSYFSLVGVSMLIISIVGCLSRSRQRMMMLSWTLLGSIYLSQGSLQLETFPNNIFNDRFHHTALSIEYSWKVCNF
jgi:hypothetical protein